MTRPTNKPIKQSALLTSSSSARIPSRQSTLCHEHGRSRMCVYMCMRRSSPRPVPSWLGNISVTVRVIFFWSVLQSVYRNTPVCSGLQQGRFTGDTKRSFCVGLAVGSLRHTATDCCDRFRLSLAIMHGPGERVADYLLCLEMYMYWI
jgi:hypothetical protein